MMRVYEMYSASPVWLQNMLISAYGVRLRMLRHGKRQRQRLRQLLESERLPADEIARRQQAALSQIWAHAAATVPYYRKRQLPSPPDQAAEALCDVPLLTKSEVRAAGRALVSDQFAGQRLQEIHTGGTTGTPLAVFCNRATLQANYAFFERFKLWAGVRDGDRVATFAGRPLVPPGSGAPYWRFNRASRAALFSSYHIAPDTVDAYLDALIAFTPKLIDSYPSSIEPLARRLAAGDRQGPRPVAIVTSSETLLPEVRVLIESTFQCRVFDHYGSAEMAAFIAQCEYGTYHVNPEFGWLELIDDDGRPVGVGERGQIIATGFINPVMPLIRYSTGDFAVRADTGPCPCGRAFPSVARLEGRMDDVVVTPDRRRVGRLDPVFKAVSGIFETRIVQDAVDHLRVEIVAPDGLREAEVAELVAQLHLRVGTGMRIDVVHVTSIPRTGRGKLRTVVSLVGDKM